jgi:hypothetical protein
MADDFSESVKRILTSRAGNRCSNPECRALTSGPQEDPTKALNLGVAAHITAASFGGPRYDPELLPEERCAPFNGIWLCQNCAKLIDNDVIRFSLEILRKWKNDAEAEAKAHVGKTAIPLADMVLDLRIGDVVRIGPIVPRVHEQSHFEVKQCTGACFETYKRDAQRRVDIPKSFIEKVHRFGDSKPGIVQLSGRLQWVSMKKNFEVFPEKPTAGSGGAYGIPKDVDPRYAANLSVAGAFAREDRLPQLLNQGWYIFYDEDGTYLRWQNEGVNQIFVVNWVL